MKLDLHSKRTEHWVCRLSSAELKHDNSNLNTWSMDQKRSVLDANQFHFIFQHNCTVIARLYNVYANSHCWHHIWFWKDRQCIYLLHGRDELLAGDVHLCVVVCLRGDQFLNDLCPLLAEGERFRRREVLVRRGRRSDGWGTGLTHSLPLTYSHTQRESPTWWWWLAVARKRDICWTETTSTRAYILVQAFSAQ